MAAKSHIETGTAAPVLPTEDDQDGNTDIAGYSAIYGFGTNDGLVMTGRGRARCQAALSGMTAVTNILFQLDLDRCCTGGIQASSMTTTGLLSALAVCTEFLSDHIEDAGRESAEIVHGSQAYNVITEMMRPTTHGGAA